MVVESTWQERCVSDTLDRPCFRCGGKVTETTWFDKWNDTVERLETVTHWDCRECGWTDRYVDVEDAG